MTIDLVRFQQVFLKMDDAVFFHDSEFRLIFANEAYYRLAGLTEAEALGKVYWEVYPIASGPLPNCHKTILDGTHSSNADEFFVGEKGFLSRGYAIKDDMGESIFSVHILSDITARISAEKSLAKTASQLKILFDSSPDAIVLLDDTAFFDCNQAALTLFGCKDRCDLIGRHPSEFSPESQPNGVDSMTMAKEMIEVAFKKGSNLFEWTHRKTDGTTFQAEVLLVSYVGEGKRALQATVRDITSRKNYEKNLADEAIKLSRALAGTVSTMSKAMELRDPYTAGHQARVALIACAIAQELHWDQSRITGLKMAGLVHDIGKIGVPSEILTKPMALSEFEEKLVQLHPEHGYGLLKDIEFPWPIAQMVYQHHERMDGSGYPLGLKGDQILLEARVLAVADTLEAVSTHRPYRPARGLAFAIELLKSESGKCLDADVVAAALRLFEGKENLEFVLDGMTL